MTQTDLLKNLKKKNHENKTHRDNNSNNSVFNNNLRFNYLHSHTMKEAINKTSDFIQWEDMNKLVRSLINEGKTKIALYIAFSANCGTRYSDTSRMTWGNIEKDSFRFIEKKTEHTKKTKKAREITINQELRKIINECKPEWATPNDLVFSKHGNKTKPLSIQYINKELKRIKEKYGVSTENFSSHSLRKTFGRRVWEKYDKSSEGLVVLQDVFNHSSPEITVRYLGIRRQEIANVYKMIT